MGVVLRQIMVAPVFSNASRASRDSFRNRLRNLWFAAFFLGEQILAVWAHVLEIVQAPVEMDDIPLGLADPSIDARQAARSRSAVGWDAVQVGFAFKNSRVGSV